MLAPMRPAFLFAALTGLCCGASIPPVRSEPARERVGWALRPDGPDDCRDLAARLASLPGGAREPSRGLGEEGVRLCAEGHVRVGAARLRRAIHSARLGQH